MEPATWLQPALTGQCSLLFNGLREEEIYMTGIHSIPVTEFLIEWGRQWDNRL